LIWEFFLKLVFPHLSQIIVEGRRSKVPPLRPSPPMLFEERGHKTSWGKSLGGTIPCAEDKTQMTAEREKARQSLF
jgi:hypothetical protein